ncbi:MULTISPECIES: hypothetical protein [Chryseobacterium]|uniref:hypothetical protein n=1 Tax=Chryseobacterium TaxID=59732 RepID=UPI00162342B9|nr:MULTISPECIES: hypothetical protein [Chryseobacterium]
MEKLNFKKIVIISSIFLIIILSVILFPLLYSKNWVERGQIGDTFNIISSFSTLIACIIGLITFIFYSQELIEQKKEIDFTSKRQNEIEKSLHDISLTLKNNTIDSRKNLEVKSYLNIIEMKRNQIQEAKLNGLTNTTISNLEIELNENISKLENLLKSI